MTKLLDQAIATAASFPPDVQDEVARVLFSYLGQDETTFELTQEDVEAVRRSRRAFARGDIAADEQVREIWAKHGL